MRVVEYPQIDEGVISGVLEKHGIESLDDLAEEERLIISKWVMDIAHVGKSDVLSKLWEDDFLEKPVSPEVFFTDEDYLGAVEGFHDQCLEDMLYVLDPENKINQWVLTGGVGWGKTTCAVAVQIYRLYYQLCLHDPGVYYDLQPGSKLITMFFGIDLSRAHISMWSKMTSFLRKSTFFMDRGFTEDKEGKGVADREIRIKFTKNDDVQVVAASRPSHALSLDVVGGILDEMEFRANKGVQDLYAEGSQAYDLYGEVSARQASRFPTSKPGLLCVISSAGTKNGFMAQHVKWSREQEDSFVSDYAVYNVAKKRYSGVRFPIEVGDDTHDSRILKQESEARKGARLEWVPVEHRAQYEKNIEESLKNISGITSYGSMKLMQNRASINDCIDDDRRHPFSKEVIEVGIRTTNFAIQDLLDMEMLVASNRNKVTGAHMPRKNPFKARYIHVDLAKKRDALGIAVGHFDGWREHITLDDEVNEKVNMHHPNIFFDILLEIRAPMGDTIDFAVILNFLFFLRKNVGFKVAKFTVDQWQSEQMRQAHEKKGVKAEIYSVDRDDKAYVAMRDAFYYRCINIYRYEPLIRNLQDVEHDLEKGKVDHSLYGAKDVSDCVASVTRQILVDHPIRYESLAVGMAVKASEFVDILKPKPKKEKHLDHSWAGKDFKGGRRKPGDFFKKEIL